VKYRLGELFSGPGGLALGAKLAGVNVPGHEIVHQWASDYDRSTCDTYIANIPGASAETVHCEDVRTFETHLLPEIEGFAFGFPCNDFSIVGEQKGIDGTFGPLYTHGISVLKTHQPLWFVAENVGGLRSSNSGDTFGLILGEMIQAGYNVVPHLYKFEQYGVPQARHRILIVGIRNDQDVEFKVPSPALYSHLDVSSQAAIECPPIAADAHNNEPTKQSPVVQERLSYILPGQNAFTADLPEHLKLNVAGATMSQIYKRLRPDKPSYTITGSGGGGTHVYHWSENRALTNRERARLQTFPDWYHFQGSKENVRKQIGMAVPVEGARVVFEAVLRTFAGLAYDSVEPNLIKRVPVFSS
jgi:DNA (cytosine-5)-methyltransferase 1